VLEIDLSQFDAGRARRGKRLPIVLTPEEVRLVLAHVIGVPAEDVQTAVAAITNSTAGREVERRRLNQVIAVDRKLGYFTDSKRTF